MAASKPTAARSLLFKIADEVAVVLLTYPKLPKKGAFVCHY
jgi:hypothetical protein